MVLKRIKLVEKGPISVVSRKAMKVSTKALFIQPKIFKKLNFLKFKENLPSL